MTALNGGTVVARIAGPTPMDAHPVQLQVDQQSGALSGTVHGHGGGSH